MKKAERKKSRNERHEDKKNKNRYSKKTTAKMSVRNNQLAILHPSIIR